MQPSAESGSAVDGGWDEERAFVCVVADEDMFAIYSLCCQGVTRKSGDEASVWLCDGKEGPVAVEAGSVLFRVCGLQRHGVLTAQTGERVGRVGASSARRKAFVLLSWY